MKILVVSDFHGDLDSAEILVNGAYDGGKKEEFDAVVLCGDLSECGSLDMGVAILEKMQEASRNVFYVTGNHDPPSLMNHKPARFDGENLVCLHGKVVKFRGLGLVGLSGFTPPLYPRWDTEGSPVTRDDEVERFLDDLISRAVNELNVTPSRIVLVTHDPPFGVCDFSVFGMNAGNQSIRRVVLKWELAAVCCGHIHEGRGIGKLGRTLVLNPGSMFSGLAANLCIEKDGEVEANLIKI